MPSFDLLNVLYTVALEIFKGTRLIIEQVSQGNITELVHYLFQCETTHPEGGSSDSDIDK